MAKSTMRINLAQGSALVAPRQVQKALRSPRKSPRKSPTEKDKPITEQPTNAVVVEKLDPNFPLEFSDLPPKIQEDWLASTSIPREELCATAVVVWHASVLLFPEQLMGWEPPSGRTNSLLDSLSTEESEVEHATPAITKIGRDEVQIPPKNKIKKVIKLSEQMGKGGFGTVFFGKDVKSKKEVAIKRVKHTTEDEQRNNFSEIGFLKFCRHPNIIVYYATYEFLGSKKSSFKELWIVTELIEGGTLHEAAKFHQFSDSHVAYFAREISRALAFLHSKNCIHRDLKSENVMIDMSGNIKLIDFGLCCDNKEGTRRRPCGSPFWIPPEMVMRQPHTFSADIWSLGICILELFLRAPPYFPSWHACVYNAVLGRMPRLIPRERMSDESIFWTEKCLKLDPVERPSAEDLLELPWVSKPGLDTDFVKVVHKIFSLHNIMDL